MSNKNEILVPQGNKKSTKFWAAVVYILAGFSLIAVVMPNDAAAATQKGDKPNVVLMPADNVCWGDIGALAGGEVRGMPTPNIDRLASEGMQMTQFFVEPGCTPSRAGLMTG